LNCFLIVSIVIDAITLMK